MAIIQIPVGGKLVGIEVPDFAMDITMQAILQEIRQQTSLMAALPGSIASSTTQTTRTSPSRNQDNAGNQQGVIQGVVGGTINAANNIMNESKGFTESISNLTQQVLDGLGSLSNIDNVLITSIPGLRNTLKTFGDNSAAIAMTVGTLVGMFEQMGQSLGTLGRIGANVGIDLNDLRNSAQEVGLGLSEISAISATYGKTVASLGKNTAEGTMRFVGFIKEFQTATQAAGYYGLQANEMAQLLIDELEIRRGLNTTLEMQGVTTAELSNALNKQIQNFSALATVTGQDVHALIRARQEFEKNEVAQSMLSSATAEQAAAASNFAAQLGMLGESFQPMLQEAFIYQMQTGSVQPEFAQVAALVQPEGINLLELVSAGVQAYQTGNQQDAVVAQDMMQQTALALDNMSKENRDLLGILALNGNENARLLLQAVSQVTPATGEGTLTDQLAVAQSDLIRATEDGTLRMQGISNDFLIISEQVKRTMANLFLGTIGFTTNEQSGRGVFGNILDTLVGGARAIGGASEYVSATSPSDAIADLASTLPDSVGNSVADALNLDRNEFTEKLRNTVDIFTSVVNPLVNSIPMLTSTTSRLSELITRNQ